MTGATKTYASRAVVLPQFLREMMAAHLAGGGSDPDGLVFTSSRGNPLRNGNWSRRYWRSAVEAAGLDGLRIHDLRHTCAALLIDQGANVKAIQTHLGHSSAQVTLDRYGHLMPDELDRLAEALDSARSGALAASSRPERGPEVVELASVSGQIGP